MVQAPAPRPELGDNRKLHQSYQRFARLIRALQDHNVPPETEERINRTVSDVDSVPSDSRELNRRINRAYRRVTSISEEELKLVAPGHYQVLWMSIGLAAFGIPFGMLFGVLMDNLGLFGIGLPMGLAIGMSVGIGMDKKAAADGRQLDVESES